MSTDYTSGMPPLDALSVDTGAFVSESAFSVGSPTHFMDVASNFLADTNGDFQRDRPIASAMEFRVIRSGMPVRRLRLTGNRYTFGSADGCSIQLNDPSLRPMHAVLIRDANRILIRAYSVPLELNDTRTTEASIHAGDVIRLGAYSFELLATTARKSERSSSPSYAASGLTHDDPILWREQLRREVAQWRARQAECDRREGRCTDRETVLRNRESELWSRAEQLHRRESHLMAQESAALQIQEDYASNHQELLRLRDENLAKQQAHEARESEFHQLEQEYREHVEEASRQLQQSQQQAEAATQAVQRMREQFADLNHQLQELQEQQAELLEREEKQTGEHQRLRLELEAARDAAVDERAEEIVRRQEIEHRIDEMDAQLRQVHAECEAERKRADESQEVAQKLRGQVEQLHENIRQADDETSQLRRDYEQACDSVRSLEAIVEQGNLRGEMDRESWYGEAEQLRQSVEQLSIDLARANGELGDLRKANEELSDRLDALTRERDEALVEVASRPTQDAFESLREELTDANNKLAEMQRDYEETLARLDLAKVDRVSECQDDETSESSSPDAVSAIATGAGAWAACDTDRATDEANAEPTEPSRSADLYQNLAEQSHHGTVCDSEAEADATTDESVVSESDADVEEPTDATQPESRSFDASQWDQDDLSDDEPQWSTEPMQKTEPPHFDTGGFDSWDTSDSDPQNHIENFEAEFDRAAVQDAADDRYTSDNQSVDNAIDLIEKNVDEAMAIDVNEDTQSAADSSEDAQQPIPASPWGYDANHDEQGDRNPQQESDVTSPWNAVESFDNENEQSSADFDDASVSPWQTDNVETPRHFEEESPSQFDEEEESIGLAGQLIKDLDSSTEGANDLLPSDHTHEWERTQPFCRQEDDDVSSAGFGWDQEYPEESRSIQWTSDPEDASDPEGASDPERDRTELILGGSIGSILETPFAQPTEFVQPEDDVANALVDSVSADNDETSKDVDEPFSVSDISVGHPEEGSQSADADDDSIEAYMNRLLNRVQGSTGSDTTSTRSTPLVPNAKTEIPDSSNTAAKSTTATPSETLPSIEPDAPMVPRSQAPERNSNLSAMRELANQSARTAVAHSVRIQARDTQIKAIVEFVKAGVAGVCAIAFFVFLDWPLSLKMLGVGAILVIAGILVREGVILLQESRRRLHAADPNNDGDTSEDRSGETA